ncbi:MULTISPECIES: thioredoxin family protein [unclassified Bacillus (in: firmicutes)]|uniref:thioredoxin family protein n=1 Tax=unclassified Bacillus (in: firmicutes) TaxID=185979 RepID=UPI0008F10F19|nr:MULTISPECIES: thioredoxin family protein [unclassified Bacillus (in: firmicutes)]SFB23330.1 Thioredoxin [Bacillus sp. UNCCL13]SFQ87720.1 Thioredoxin [Bacillus sp. cl95]
MKLNEWFEKGMTIEQYVESMKVNKEEMLGIYENFTVDEAFLNMNFSNKRVIVLTEDWCGDAMLNNAILMKIASSIRLDMRFLARDENLELMDQYLTNGTSRAIPIYIFINEDGSEFGVWGPRADKVQALVEEGRLTLPDKESAEFPEKQKEFYTNLMSLYRNDRDIWREVEKSIMRVLNK